jgi:lipid-binding SYLF domain-containing protein
MGEHSDSDYHNIPYHSRLTIGDTIMADIIKGTTIERIVYNKMTGRYVGYYTDHKGREYIHIINTEHDLDEFLKNNELR